MLAEGPSAAKFYCLRSCCENPGPKSIPQFYGVALNSNDSHITREVNSQNVFSCCSHVICGSEIQGRISDTHQSDTMSVWWLGHK